MGEISTLQFHRPWATKSDDGDWIDVFEPTIEVLFGTIEKDFTENQIDITQFTGLHDKNGKEIYEGDVITCYAIQREVNEVIEQGSKVVVKYQNGYFYPFGYNAGWRSEVGDIEIIGNIYENPELLKT